MEPQSSTLSPPESRLARPLKLLLDGRKLGHGGIGTYLDNLIWGLLERPEEVALTLIVGRGGQGAPSDSRLRIIEDRAQPYSLSELLLLPKRVRARDYDIFHSPHFTLPYGLGIPSVVTVHDLIHLTHPERRYYPFVARRLIGSAIGRASKVVTVSEATARELRATFSAASDKVTVVPNALDPHFAKPARGSLDAQRKYFVALFSNLKPHKRPADLLRAFESIAWEMKMAEGVELLLVGQAFDAPGWQEQLGELPSQVRVMGALPQERLIDLMRGALALVVPSVAEGFCLPALEARALGVPLVVRPVSAVLELIGERDVICTDLSVDALRAGMERILITQATRPRALPGPQFFERYSRATLAQRMAEIYSGAVGLCAQ